jgi:DNA-3-methyladenine glycosylase
VTRRPLPAAFYARETTLVARELLGAVLECTVRGTRCRGRIVETEAYMGEEDPACHAAAGRTARTEVLYGPPGCAYVYFIYGMHWCVNAVTRRAGLPSAVLIRAVEPLEGIGAMRRRRDHRRDRELTNGPGKLCAAFGITGPRHHGASLIASPLRILAGDGVPEADVAVTPRVGIVKAAEERLRWIVRSSEFVSGRPRPDQP